MSDSTGLTAAELEAMLVALKRAGVEIHTRSFEAGFRAGREHQVTRGAAEPETTVPTREREQPDEREDVWKLKAFYRDGLRNGWSLQMPLGVWPQEELELVLRSRAEQAERERDEWNMRGTMAEEVAESLLVEVADLKAERSQVWGRQLREAEATVQRLEKALEFYADHGNWTWLEEIKTGRKFSYVEDDEGEIAVAALAVSPSRPEPYVSDRDLADGLVNDQAQTLPSEPSRPEVEGDDA